MLRGRGLLPIIGASGDGKTTLAIGVAGHLWKEGFPVFNYQPPATGRPLPLQDVLTFMQAADRSCVLILDDANRAFSETDLTQVGATAGRPVLVLATWTRDRLEEDPRPERHLAGCLLVNWEQIRPSVESFLLAHEVDVVTAIQKYQDPNEPRRVGLGFMDTSLAEHIKRYEAEAKTVSEFLFLLRGGAHVVQTEIEALADDSRSDTPVLYAAIEQIAGFEKPVTPDETASAIQREIQGSGLPAPTTEWVRDVFRAQLRRRCIQEVRGAFKTVHRDWGARLIGAGLAETDGVTGRLRWPVTAERMRKIVVTTRRSRMEADLLAQVIDGQPRPFVWPVRRELQAFLNGERVAAAISHAWLVQVVAR